MKTLMVSFTKLAEHTCRENFVFLSWISMLFSSPKSTSVELIASETILFIRQRCRYYLRITAIWSRVPLFSSSSWVSELWLFHFKSITVEAKCFKMCIYWHYIYRKECAAHEKHLDGFGTNSCWTTQKNDSPTLLISYITVISIFHSDDAACSPATIYMLCIMYVA